MANLPSKSGEFIKTKLDKKGDTPAGMVEVYDSEKAKEPKQTYKVKAPVDTGKLGSVTFMGNDKDGHAFFRIEMLMKDKVIKTTRFIARYTSDGKEAGVFEIPSDGIGTPTKDIRVAKDGSVFVMVPYSDRVEVLKWKPE